MFKLVKFLKPYKKECIIGPLFKLFEAILELLLPTIMALIINNGVLANNQSYVFKMGALMLFMAILGYGCSLVCQYYAARASQGFGTTLRNVVFEHISTLSYAELDKFGTASLINRLTNDINQLQLAIAMLIRLVIRAPFICIGAVTMAMLLDLKLSLILLAAIPVFAIILYLIISKTAPLYRIHQQKLDKMVVLVRENLLGVRVIRAFTKTDYEKKRFTQANADLTDTAIYVNKISAMLNPLTSLVMNAAIIAILWVGGLQINLGRLSQGEIIAFVNYITQILLALIVVSNLVVIFTKAFASANRVTEILDTTTSTIEMTSIPCCTKDDNAPIIQLNNVSYSYSGADEKVLNDISVVIGHGETIGIIGGTGSGKSTLINLIPRFYDVTEGEMLFCGVNVKEYSLTKLREKIRVVPQQAMLFSGTIAENIRWGKEDATDEEVVEAATIAQASDFIAKLPNGYDTQVSRGGQNFSGGQKQRLTIARALVAKPLVLILDDASSALDYATDFKLRQAIKQTSALMTVIIVSQRANTIKHADKILVLDDGNLVGLGTHIDLLNSCNVYREIYLSQKSDREVG